MSVFIFIYKYHCGFIIYPNSILNKIYSIYSKLKLLLKLRYYKLRRVILYRVKVTICLAYDLVKDKTEVKHRRMLSVEDKLSD